MVSDHPGNVVHQAELGLCVTGKKRGEEKGTRDRRVRIKDKHDIASPVPIRHCCQIIHVGAMWQEGTGP